MSSLLVTGAVCALVASFLVNIWFFLNSKDQVVQKSNENGFVSEKAQVAAASDDQPTGPLTIPEGWWSSAKRFQTERRAIFSQSWMCVSHRGRFKKPGDYIVYEVAGFRFFMILGKDKIVRSFHNVCRHRAFPVARKQSGTATVLGCRYHGWSYDTTGKLTKAPYFDNVPGFDRSKLSLYEIQTKEDSRGFLHINPSTDDHIAKTKPAAGISSGKQVKITPDATQLHTFEVDGKFNWKLLFNTKSKATSASLGAAGMERFFPGFSAVPLGELNFFPLTSVHMSSEMPFWFQLTFNPVSEKKTSLRCDVYSMTESVTFSEGMQESLEAALKQSVQNLEVLHKKVSSSGFNPVATDRAQGQIAEAVEGHLKQERLRGQEIKPAEVKQHTVNNDFTEKAESLCRAMECGDKKLEW